MAAQQQTIRVSHPAAVPQTSDSSIGMSNMTTTNKDAVRIVTTVARDQNAPSLTGGSSTNNGQVNYTTQQLPHQQVRRVVITASNDNQQRAYQQQQPQTHGLPVRYSNPGQPQQQYVVRYSQPQQQQQQPTVLVTSGNQQQQQPTVVIGGPPPLRRVDSRPLLLHQQSQQQLLRPPPNNYSQQHQQQQQQQQSRPVLLVNNQQQQQQQVRYSVGPNPQQQIQQNPQQNLRPGVTFVQPANQLNQPQQRPLKTIIQQQPLQQYSQVIYRQQQPQGNYIQSNQQIQQPVYKQVIRPQQLQQQTVVQNPVGQSSEGGRQNAPPVVNGVMGGENSKLQGIKSRSYSVNLSHPSGAPLTEEDRRRSLSLIGQTSIEEHQKTSVNQNEVLKRQSSGVFSFIKRKDQQQIPQNQNTNRIMDQQQPQQRADAASDSPQKQVPAGVNETIASTSMPVEPKENKKDDTKSVAQDSESTKKSLMNGKATVIKDEVQLPERPVSGPSGVEERKQDVKDDSSGAVAQKSAQDLNQASALNLKQEKSDALIDRSSTESKVNVIKGDSAKDTTSKVAVPPEQPVAQGKESVDHVTTSDKHTVPVAENQIIVNGDIRDDASIAVSNQGKSPSPVPELKQQINGHVVMEDESERTAKSLLTENISPKSQTPRNESPIPGVVQSSVLASVPKSPAPAEKIASMSMSPRTESPKPEDMLSLVPKSPIPPEKSMSTSGSSRTESPNPELVQSSIPLSPASKSPVPQEKSLNTSVSPLADSHAAELSKSSTPSPVPKSPIPSKSPSPLPGKDIESVRTESPKVSEVNVEKSPSKFSESTSTTVVGNATDIPQSTANDVPSHDNETSKNMIGASLGPLPAETKVKTDSPSPEIHGRDTPSMVDKAAISISPEPGVRGPSPIEEKKQPKELVTQQEPVKETSPSQVVSPSKTISEIKNINEVASSKEVVPPEELLIKEGAAVSQEPVTKETSPAISRKTPSPEQREISRSPAPSNGHERPKSSKEIQNESKSPALTDNGKTELHEADIQRIPSQASIDDLPEHEKSLLESLDTVCVEASSESKAVSKSPLYMNGHALNLTKSPSPALSNKSPSPVTKKSPILSKAPSPEQKPVSPISPKSSTKPSPTEGLKSVESKSPKDRGSPIIETVINKEIDKGALENNVPEDVKHDVTVNGKLSSPEGDSSDKLKLENGTQKVKKDKNETATESEDEKVVSKQKIISEDDAKPKKKIIKKRIKESTDTKGDHDSGVDETTQGNEPSANGDVGGSPKKSPSKIPGAGGRRVMSPTKTPRSPIKADPAPAPEKKKVPMNKVQVGAAPSPNLKTVRSKIGSLDNASYRPGGGHVKIEHRKLDFSKTQPKIAAKNDTYIPGGGDKKIQQVKLTWNAKPKVGSLDNATHKPGGGDKKIETVKLDFKDRAKPKIGSKDNVKHVPGGGTVKNAPSSLEGNSSDIENKKLEFKVQSKVGSLANVTYKPGGGDIKIFDDKDYLRQMSGGSLASSEGRASGAQSPIPASPSRALSEHSQGES